MSYIFRSSDEHTTDTEDSAMAADPIQGFKTIPTGRKTPSKGNKDMIMKL